MDSLTHVVVAGTLSMALSGRGSAIRRTALLAGAALLPDAAEQVFRLLGTATYLRFYHAPLHSLLGMALMVILLTLATRRWEEPSRFLVQLMPAAVGMGSHLLLDLAHGWGVELFWPLSERRFGVPLIANYDLPTLGLLGIALLAPALLNSVNREIGAPRVNGRRSAWIALSLLVLLVPARWVFRARASNLVHGAPLTEDADSISVYPSALLPWYWTAVEDTSLAYLIGEVDGLTGERRAYLVRLRKAQPNSLFLAVRDSDAGQNFLRMATYPYYSFEEGKEAILVRLRDMAFYAPAGSDRPFSLETEITSTLKVVSEKAVF